MNTATETEYCSVCKLVTQVGPDTERHCCSIAREEARRAERQRLLLVIQSLPPTSAGAGAFKTSVIAALEAAKEGKRDG